MIHQNATIRTLIFLRLYIFGIWFFNYLLIPFQDLAFLPKEFLSPTGPLLVFLPLNILHMLLSTPSLIILKILTLLSLAWIIIDQRAKTPLIIFCVLMTLYESLTRSFGYVNHGETMLMVSTYILSFHFLFNTSSSKPKTSVNIHAVPLCLILIFLTSCYSWLAIHRLIYGGRALFASSSLMEHIIIFSNTKLFYSVANFSEWLVRHPMAQKMINIGYVLITFTELFAPLTLVNRFYRRYFIVLMVCFHIMTCLFMGIFFWKNTLLYLLLFDLEKISNLPLIKQYVNGVLHTTQIRDHQYE